MAYVALTDSEIQSGEPLSQALMQKIKDDFDDHEARISSGGGGGGAIGGGGVVLNGSLEADADEDGVPDNFIVAYYPGGSGAFDTDDYVHGTRSWRFDLGGGANTGGGYLETDYIFANRFYFNPIWLAYKSESTSGIPRVQVIARCFDKNQAYLGDVTLWSTVSHLSGWNIVVIHNPNISFVETEYVKFRIVGGAVDATGVVGSVWFDAIGIEGCGMSLVVPESINQIAVSVINHSWATQGSVFNINILEGKYQWLVVPVIVAGGATARCYIDSVYSSEVADPGGNCVLYIGGMSGAKQLRFQGVAVPDDDRSGTLASPLSLRKFYATNYRVVDHWAGTETNTYVKPPV